MDIGTKTVEAASQAYSTYAEEKTSKKADYGKTIGNPSLSEEGQKYYEQLKKKYGNMDFILVSKDMKEQAKANAASYANPNKMVVLIDEEKVERMATDENFRKQYEALISSATTDLAQMKQSMVSTGAKVKGFGMQLNDGGTMSFFAVLKKSTAAQKERIAKKAAENKAEKKAEAKKQSEEARKNSKTTGREKTEEADEEETVTITASSLEELLQKINDYTFAERSNSVQTEEEKMIGQHIDFQG